MSYDNDPLCCCEYFDIQQERNHLLLCCCNCQDLDESFDSLISGRSVSQNNVKGFMATLQDRLRIPWVGGARRIPIDTILPVILLPIMLGLATISLWWTFSIFSIMLMMLSYLYYLCMKSSKRTRFFLVWGVTSLVILFFIFEFVVIPLLEILVHENVAVILLAIPSIACIYFAKLRNDSLRYNAESAVETGESGKAGRMYYCPICQISVPGRDHHCVWLDCCIGSHNRFLFVIAITLGIGALVYSSNLTLTSVCHPFHVYKTILLPDDCSDVYDQHQFSIPFVSGLYSIGISLVLLVYLLYEVLLISVGLTGQEWRALPISAKLCCAITTHRPYNKGILCNWYREIWSCQRYPQAVSQY